MIVLSGLVVHGKGLGHKHNMPTANVKCDAEGLKKGVYGGYCLVDNNKYQCVVNIGTRPSVDNENTTTVEAFLLDFDGDLYGKTIELQLPYFLREIIKFNNIEEVSQQVQKDIQMLKDLVK